SRSHERRVDGLTPTARATSPMRASGTGAFPRPCVSCPSTTLFSPSGSRTGFDAAYPFTKEKYNCSAGSHSPPAEGGQVGGIRVGGLSPRALLQGVGHVHKPADTELVDDHAEDVAPGRLLHRHRHGAALGE